MHDTPNAVMGPFHRGGQKLHTGRVVLPVADIIFKGSAQGAVVIYGWGGVGANPKIARTQNLPPPLDDRALICTLKKL